MTDKPIIFSAPMIRALIEGRKTQTRRVLKPLPGSKNRGFVMDSRLPCAPGDRLWVKEAWRTDLANDHLRPSELDPGTATVWFDASSDWNEGQRPRYRNARFMPRWASRLTLTVTDVRVQRVQDISEADAVAEGVNPCLEGNQCPDGPHGGCCAMYDPKGAYAALWNTIHGPDAWERNPWVAAYTFTVQRGNIDGGKS